jgi:diguanylate cyclase (GGDEF)-like protein
MRDDLLDILCPLHLGVDRDGTITHLGPTLRRISGECRIIGTPFLEGFDLLRPRNVTRFADLLNGGAVPLRLVMRCRPQVTFKGLLAPHPDGAAINLSFGISVFDAVRDFHLSGSDFAATDLTMEMLYLVEAKSAAMTASRQLNQRLRGAKDAAEEQATSDTLTGFRNRRAMDALLDRLIAAGSEFALMHIDLDFFKAVNDTHGHAAGDFVLQQVARIMVDETRSDDTVARIGGDEFVLILNGLSDRVRLDRIAARIIERLEQPILFGDRECRISASAGTVLSRDYVRPDPAEMLADADLALYSSKNGGRAQHRFFDPAMRSDRTGAGPATRIDPGGGCVTRSLIFSQK